MGDCTPCSIQKHENELSARIEKATRLILDCGPCDGAHHKDWVLQQVYKILSGLKEGELKPMLERIGWEEGIPP